ncbi:TPA: PKD domain-containing protein [Thermoplasmata archaeon]|nr:PKD domain-containing protein [Thermoplasmata archaeon]
MSMDIPPPPEDDSELPPPPAEIAETSHHYPEIKVHKSGPLATVHRAFVIFEKDIRTMAKHGLVSSVILFVFLMVIFSIMSFAMKQAMSFDIGSMMDGDEIDVPWATESNPPTADAGNDRTVSAGTTVRLDATGSHDDDRIVHYQWSFWEVDYNVDLFGARVDYTFNYVGVYEIRLTVVDYSINQAEDNVTITVTHATSDTEAPWADVPWSVDTDVDDTVDFAASNSTDNVGVVNWTWVVHDVVETKLYGEEASYRFRYASDWEFGVTLILRDASGNYNNYWVGVNVHQLYEDYDRPWAEVNEPGLVVLGDTVTLDGSGSGDDSSQIDMYTWYINHNGTFTVLTGQTVEFTPSEWGWYEVMLIVRDEAGNYNDEWNARTGFIVAPLGVEEVNAITWKSTPFGVDVSFNLLTYAYGVALLSSVIFVGGLFAKGFSHEIQKGTIKILFFGPISVTTTIFSKILYPIVVGPFLIFPLTMGVLATFEQSPGEIFVITLVAYSLVVMTMVAAAYGSCLVYYAVKRMVLKPPVFSRMFMYLSLLGTLTVFEWLSFVLDMWLEVDTYGDMYDKYAIGIAMFSPFHHGGEYLSNSILGTTWTIDWGMFLIPILLIVLGVIASKRLYPDLFSRE